MNDVAFHLAWLTAASVIFALSVATLRRTLRSR